MWAVDNRTAFGADRTWVRDVAGAHRWIVAVRATLQFDARGRIWRADEQVPPLLAPEYNGEDGASSLRYEADLVPMKPGTDVLVNGHAHAPNGKPAAEVPVALSVAGRKKVLLVRGENVFHGASTALATTSPQPFTRMPIVYERAYGGTDTEDPDLHAQRMDLRNPVGVGVATSASKLVGKPGPNVVYPGQDLVRVGPAGFGPLASHWSPRREHAGTYDAAWVEQRMPLLPLDWNPQSLLCSPVDQRPEGYLRGGVPITLINLTPEGSVTLELPKIFLGFTSYFGHEKREHRGQLVTVILEPDERRLVMVWQTELLVKPRDVDYLDRTLVVEKSPIS